MPWIDIHDRQLANPGGLVRTEQATCYTGKCYFASEYINVGDSIENKLRQLGAKPAKSVSGKTQVFAIGHNADMSKTDPAREKGIPIMAVADQAKSFPRAVKKPCLFHQVRA